MFNENISYTRQAIDEDSLIIGMEGDDREEITARFNAFWNWMATNGELDWRTDRLAVFWTCLLYTSPSPRDGLLSRMPSSA